MQSHNGSSPFANSKDFSEAISHGSQERSQPKLAQRKWGMKERDLAGRIGKGLAATSQKAPELSRNPSPQLSDRDNREENRVPLNQDTIAVDQGDSSDLALTNRALLIQQDLLTTWVRTVRMAAGTLMVKALLQQILEVCQTCGNAEQGSLFLLDEAGAVSECLLARGATIREQKRAIVGRILDEGLAAWVIEHRKIGWIQDTVTDDRWIVLPDQPYTVRSAMCVPLQRGKRILGLVTLTHETPNHFSPDCVRLMEKVSDAIALVLENAQLYSEHGAPAVAPREEPHAPIEKPSRAIARALYITTAEGKLRYVNRQFAMLFGYRRRDIAKMESILDLIPVDYQDQFVQQMQRCIEQADTPVECQISGRHRDGRLLPLAFYAERIHFSRRPGTLGVVYPVPLSSPDSGFSLSGESDLSEYGLSDLSHFSGFNSEFVIDTDFEGKIPPTEPPS